MTDRPHLGTVQLPRLAAGRDEVLWPAMLDLAAALPQPWTLIGGQMVYLHGALAGRSPHRFTEDIDVVFDMRVEVNAITKADRALERLGYEVAGISADGLAYRYRNGDGVEVDILAPDHLGERVLSKLHTPHGRTVRVPGATKALQHSCSFTASYGDREEVAFVPSLLTAINIKLKAMGLPGPTERTGSRHLDDIAFRFDNEMLVTPHLFATPGSAAPLLHLRRQGDEGLFSRFADHFDSVWGTTKAIEQTNS